MILDWLSQTPVVLTAFVIVFVPGMAALYGVGLRGLGLLAASPLFGVASAALIAVGFGAVGIDWTPLSWAVATIIVIGLAWAAGKLLGLHPAPSARSTHRWLLPTALIIGVIVGVWRLAAYIAEPAGISQTNDAVFHMNAVRFILETADASSLHVSGVIGGSGFYPSAWHGVVSLITMFTGTSIAIAANALTLVIGAVIWPLGIAWLTVAITGSTVVAGYSAVLSSALQTFPLLMFQWGVLFPNALSTTLLPAAVALVISLPRLSRGSARWRSGVRDGLLLLIVAGSLVLAQPAGLLPWAAISTVWFSFWLFGNLATIGRARVIAFAAAAWIGTIALWLGLAQGTSGSHWPPFRGKLEVLLDVLLNGHVLIPFAYGVSALMLVGIVVAARRRDTRWFVVAWFGISVLYVLVAAIGSPLIRDGILGAWYADPYRIAALAPIVVIPLAAVGADAIVRAVAGWVHRPVDDLKTTGIGLAGVTVFMIVLVVLRPVAMPAFLQGTYDRESRYLAAEDAFLDPDERALLESLDELVEPGARVLGNPSTGSGFGYFLSGVDVFPRTWSPPASQSWTVLGAHLRDVAVDADVCEALMVYGQPEYVLDFGVGEEGPGRYELPGMTDFSGQDGFELVAEDGEVSLWRITACDQ